MFEVSLTGYVYEVSQSVTFKMVLSAQNIMDIQKEIIANGTMPFNIHGVNWTIINIF